MSDIIREILHLARWAPSGDNTQPWRFEIVDAQRFIIHGFDTRDHCVYDLDGHPSQISLGALIENIIIAASAHGLRADYSRRLNLPETQPTFDVTLIADTKVSASPLLPFIATRSVQRRPLDKTPLSATQKSIIEAAVGEDYYVQWIEGDQRKQAAKLMFNNAKLRLTMPEAFEVHRSIIDWDKQYSEDKVPDQALGADAVTVKLMRWIMQSWGRVEFFNKYLAGTLAPRLQMDWLPGLNCGAHFVLKSRSPARSLDDYVEAGRAVQRLWLSAEQQDLRLQPEVTPLIFARYVREGIRFTKVEALLELARSLQAQYRELVEVDQFDPVFMGRVGFGPVARSRSTRMSLDKLIVTSPINQNKSSDSKTEQEH